MSAGANEGGEVLLIDPMESTFGAPEAAEPIAIGLETCRNEWQASILRVAMGGWKGDI